MEDYLNQSEPEKVYALVKDSRIVGVMPECFLPYIQKSLGRHELDSEQKRRLGEFKPADITSGTIEVKVKDGKIVF